MFLWEIFGGNLPHIRIEAKSFDEAIKKARLQNERYCGGFIVEEDEI